MQLRATLLLFTCAAVSAAAAGAAGARAQDTHDAATPIAASADSTLGAASDQQREDRRTAASAAAGDPVLRAELALLAKQRLAPPEATSVDELDALLEEAHERRLAGRNDEATLLLLEAVEGPRFRAFEELEPFAAAELALVAALIDQRAYASADRSVKRLLARGAKQRTFGPAFRRGVDIALARREYAKGATELEALAGTPASPLVQDELHYLRGLAAHDAGDVAAAKRELTGVSGASRFYPSAQYLLAAIAARAQQFDEAEQRLCAVRSVSTSSSAPRALYTSGELVASDDETRLALGRVAHERGQYERAFDHYFSVPADSSALAEALFEAAYASYERGEHTLALDSLDQLEARHPGSPLAVEARVLRGYVHLGRCDFGEAEKHLVSFEQTFGRLLRELDITIESPGLTRALYERARAEQTSSSHALTLESLIRRDPEVERLRASLAALDGELARSGNTANDFGLMAARVRRGEAKHARPKEDELSVSVLRERLRDTRAAVEAYGAELARLERAQASPEDLGLLKKIRHELARRLDRAETELRALADAREQAEFERRESRELAESLDQERAHTLAVEQRGEKLRAQLERALDGATRSALHGARERLAKELRRARIGRIDAVMGKKRKLELEVESLAKGRFPPELTRGRKRPVLLRDDEEYWPYEGEDWPDEFREAGKSR